MGMYDFEISSLKWDINFYNDQIKMYRTYIDELEEMLDKCDQVNNNVSGAMESIFQKIDGRAASIGGNFAERYKKNIDQIAKKNRIYDISGNTTNDKSKIKDKILFYEQQIERSYKKIADAEADLAYYEEKNK